jgi:hypothetical protein
MTSALVEFANNGNSKTSTLSGHSAKLPKLVIEKRRVPEGLQKIAEYSCKVIYATTDAESNPLSSKVSYEVIARYPIDGQTSDITGGLAVLRDIVAGDEFANSVDTQEWLS